MPSPYSLSDCVPYAVLRILGLFRSCQSVLPAPSRLSQPHSPLSGVRVQGPSQPPPLGGTSLAPPCVGVVGQSGSPGLTGQRALRWHLPQGAQCPLPGTQ